MNKGNVEPQQTSQRFTSKLLSILDCLPRTTERVFPTSYRVFSPVKTEHGKELLNFRKNPRLLSIELRSLRHWREK